MKTSCVPKPCVTSVGRLGRAPVSSCSAFIAASLSRSAAADGLRTFWRGESVGAGSDPLRDDGGNSILGTWSAWNSVSAFDNSSS